jgi:hypothetical protein
MPLAIPIAARHVNRYLVLLTTEKSALAYGELARDFTWGERVALPNSEQMIMALGRRM